MDKTVFACQASIELVFDRPDPGFRPALWTFTAKKATPIDELGAMWHAFTRLLAKHKIKLRGVRVFEVHPGEEVVFSQEDSVKLTPREEVHEEVTGRFARPAVVEHHLDAELRPSTESLSHGWHVHLATPTWYDVKILRAVAAKVGFGRIHVSAHGKGKTAKDAARYLAKYVSKGFSTPCDLDIDTDGVSAKKRPYYLKGIRLWARVGRFPGVLVSKVVSMGALPEACRARLRSVKYRVARLAMRRWRAVYGERKHAIPARVGWVMGVDAWPECPAQAGWSDRSLALKKGSREVYRALRLAAFKALWTKRVIYRALQRVRADFLADSMAAVLKYHGPQGHEMTRFTVSDAVFFQRFPFVGEV